MANEKRLIDANAIPYEKRTECFGHGEFFEVQKVYKEQLNCKNCGEQSSCWYGQNKEPKKCDSYWNASSVRTDSG